MGSEPKRMNAIIKDPLHFKRLVESLQRFHVRQDLKDLCFVCARGERVFAHKLLICSVSTQMKNMFLEIPDHIDMITIHMPDIESRLLKLLFDFFYEGALRVLQADYDELLIVMKMLGIVLSKSCPGVTQSQLFEAPPSSQAQLSIQPQSVFYVQASGPNSQGQMQYVLASPAMLPQGQMMHVAPAGTPGQVMQAAQAPAHGQLMQVTQAPATGQVMQMAPAAAPGQVLQAGGPTVSMSQGQIMQMAPAIMGQANNQMVQGDSQVVVTSMQQNNMMQVPQSNTSMQQNNMMQVPQSNTQVMPMVTGNQMVQCSNQMVVQGSQPTLINTNQNQVLKPAQRSHYVMSSSANQMTTSRAQAQYTQPQVTPQQRIVARSRTTAQPIRTNANNSADGSINVETILAILQENYDSLETLTARDLREALEPKLGMDLSNAEELIDKVLQSFRKESENVSDDCEITATTKAVTRTKPAPDKVKVVRRRKKRVNFSDDEDDEDFNPKKPSRKS